MYNLGPERGSIFPIDDDWLEIQLDEKEKVVKNRIRAD
jgi:hypothetical protein